MAPLKQKCTNVNIILILLLKPCLSVCLVSLSFCQMALSGWICVVTGASRGIGRGIALQLSEAGATVYITGRQEKTLKETAAEV